MNSYLTRHAILFDIKEMIETGSKGFKYVLAGHRTLEMLNDPNEIGICMRDYYGRIGYSQFISKANLTDEVLADMINSVTNFGGLELRERAV